MEKKRVYPDPPSVDEDEPKAKVAAKEPADSDGDAEPSKFTVVDVTDEDKVIGEEEVMRRRQQAIRERGYYRWREHTAYRDYISFIGDRTNGTTRLHRQMWDSVSDSL